MSREECSLGAVSFRDARWKTRWVVTGLVFLLLLRGSSLVVPDLSPFISDWLHVVIGFVPQVFFLIFPIVTRDPRSRRTFGFPGPKRCLIEFAITIPVVILTMMLVFAVQTLIDYVSPGASLTPDEISDLSKSPKHAVVYSLLLGMFTFVPVAEELFFRGFLQNAFRARMPLVCGTLLQCFIFGFTHSFGLVHSAVASVLGLLLTVVYTWRKTLLAPMFVHAGINFVAAVAIVAMMNIYADRPMLGIVGDQNDSRCVVRKVVSGSAAEEAGIQMGDVILSFNNEPIHNFAHLAKTGVQYRPGDAIPVVIDRAGSLIEVTVVLKRHSP